MEKYLAKVKNVRSVLSSVQTLDNIRKSTMDGSLMNVKSIVNLLLLPHNL
jgi:hypothetical protein